MNQQISGSRLFLNMCDTIEKNEQEIMTDPKFKKNVEEMFLKVVGLVQTRLINAISPFWGIALMGVQKSIDWKQRGFIDLKIEKPIVLSFNPFFIEHIKSETGIYDIRLFIGYLVSELLRLIYKHPSFFSKYPFLSNEEKAKLEMASDINVSEILKDDANRNVNDIRIRHAIGSNGKKTTLVDNNGRSLVESDDPNDLRTLKLLIPEQILSLDKANVVTTQSLASNKAIEYYYHALKDSKIDGDDDQNTKIDAIAAFSSGSSEGDSEQPDATPRNDVGKPIHDWANGSEQLEMDSMINEYLTTLSMKTRGLGTSGIQQTIDKPLQSPERDYRELFSDMLYSSESSEMISSRMCFNRRQPDRLDLFGKRGISHKHVYIAVDTSASTYGYMPRFIIETMSIAREAMAEITIIECDYEIQKIYDAFGENEIDAKFKGFGGTRFSPVIDFVNGTKVPDEYKQFWRPPDESVLCYFTDGYGEISIPRPKIQKILWVSIGGHMSLGKPYGKVVSLKDEWEKNRRW